ncbi:MAG: GNAT family N-acetyltransferase [Chloroflexota bacterium]
MFNSQKMNMKNTRIDIREAQIPDDYQGIISLWQSAGPGIHITKSDSLEEINKKQLRDPDLFLVADFDGEVIGTILGGFDGRRGIVYHLAVSESHRKQGVGESLMNELEVRLRRKGCIRCYLLVTLDSQKNVDFYLKRGWEKMELLIMAKDIG